MLTYLLPMLGSIRGICCFNDGVELLEQHFPGTLALAKELRLACPKPASIPTYLNWLDVPQNFGEHGPRFLWAHGCSETLSIAIMDAVRKV